MSTHVYNYSLVKRIIVKCAYHKRVRALINIESPERAHQVIIDSNATHRKHYSSPDWELNIKMRVHISRHNMLYNVDSDNLQRPRDDHARSSEADDLP
jgi:hypothetical protein